MTFASSVKIYDDAAVLHLYRICGDAILFEARLTNPATSMKFPIVPRADDIIAIEATLAERASDMVASIGNRAEFSIFERYRDILVHRCDALQRVRSEFIHVTNIDPVFIFSHNDLCSQFFTRTYAYLCSLSCYAVTGRVFLRQSAAEVRLNCTRVRLSSI